MIGPTYKEVLSKSENLTVILENFRYLVINTEYNPSIFNIFAFNDKFLLETLILKEKRKALV